MPAPNAEVQQTKQDDYNLGLAKMSKKAKQKQLQEMYLKSNKRYFEIAAVTAFFIVWPLSFYYNIILKTNTFQAALLSGVFFL